jgi:hypothetical protein
LQRGGAGTSWVGAGGMMASPHRSRKALPRTTWRGCGQDTNRPAGRRSTRLGGHAEMKIKNRSRRRPRPLRVTPRAAISGSPARACPGRLRGAPARGH